MLQRGDGYRFPLGVPLIILFSGHSKPHDLSCIQGHAAAENLESYSTIHTKQRDHHEGRLRVIKIIKRSNHHG